MANVRPPQRIGPRWEQRRTAPSASGPYERVAVALVAQVVAACPDRASGLLAIGSPQWFALRLASEMAQDMRRVLTAGSCRSRLRQRM